MQTCIATGPAEEVLVDYFTTEALKGRENIYLEVAKAT